MPIEIQVTYDVRELSVWLSRANMPALQRAVGSALNRTIAQVKTQASRSVRNEIKLKTKDINNRLVVIRANSAKGALTQMQASLRVSGKPVPLISYGAKQPRQGVVVQIKNNRTVLKHAFIARMRSGHQGVFIRKGNKRLPIQELYSTRVSDVFNNTGFMPNLASFAQEKFIQSFAHNLDYFFRKQR